MYTAYSEKAYPQNHNKDFAFALNQHNTFYIYIFWVKTVMSYKSEQIILIIHSAILAIHIFDVQKRAVNF